MLPAYAEDFGDESHMSRYGGGFAVFQKNGQYGAADTQRNTALPAVYGRPDLFGNGMARAPLSDRQEKNPIGAADTKKRGVLPPKRYDFIWEPTEGMSVVGIGNKYGFIDSKGRLVVPVIYDGAERFADGKAGVQVGKKWGFVDKTGRLVIRPQFDYVGSFFEGTGTVCRFKNGNPALPIDKCTLINEQGKPVIPYVYEDIGSFMCGLARTRAAGGRYGFLDKEGKEAVPVIYDDVLYAGEDCRTLFLRKGRREMYVPNPKTEYHGRSE